MRPPKGCLTQSESLLFAAAGLGETFSPEELTVRVWELDRRFGLRGYANLHPNTKMVAVLLSTKAGPVKRGQIEKCGVLKYRLTDAGRVLVRKIRDRLASRRVSA